MKKRKLYDKKIIYLFFIPLILIAKYFRYTFMYNTLIVNGIGHSWVNKILYEKLKFEFWQSDTIVNTTDNAITFFQKINIFDISTYIGWEIYITIIFNVILILILMKVKSKLNLEQFIYICLSILVLNIFDFCLAKEPFQMLYFILIFIIIYNKNISNKLKFILCICVYILSALTLRNYYILIAFFALTTPILFKLIIFKKKKIKIYHVIKLFVIFGLLYFLILNIAKVVVPNEYSEVIALRTRYRGNAATQINNILSSPNLLFFSINYLINVVRLIFPFELFTLGFKYFPYILYQIFMSYYLIKSIINIKNNSENKTICLYLYIGFILGSAVFEPDFGSWVRHETIFFPIMLFLNNSIKSEENLYI